MAEPPPLPTTVARLSLNQVIPYALGDRAQTDVHNFEQRVFRRVIPVLHLAVALEQVIDAIEVRNRQSPSLEDLLMAQTFAPCLVERAEQLEAVLLAVTEFKIRSERLVQFRLVK